MTKLKLKKFLLDFQVFVLAMVLLLGVGIFTLFQHQGGSLSSQELARINEWLEPLVEEGGITQASSVSSFLTSYYSKPEEINIAHFLECNSCAILLKEEGPEFEALKRHPKWPFETDISLSDVPAPIHKFPKVRVNELFLEYMGIELSDVKGIGEDELIYLEDYDSYYNFTSGFCAGTFVAESGKHSGNDLILVGNNGRTQLILEEKGGKWLIKSHKLISE